MLKQGLQQKLQQKLSPQQIQLMKIIQLPLLDFEQYIEQELDENPALESGKQEEYEKDEEEFDPNEDYEDHEIIDADHINIDEYLSDDEIPEYKLYSNNYDDDQEEKEMPYRAELSFYQSLMNQLNNFRLSDFDWDIAEFLVGSINDNGYIRRDLQSIADDLAFKQNIIATKEEVERVLKNVIFELDPPGVGARDLQESLIIQLKRKKQTESVALAIKILNESFEVFSKKHFQKLLSKYDISQEELQKAISEIEKLNPKPGSAYSENVHIEQIVPDFTIRINDNELELLLNSRNAPELHISKEYTQMLETYRDSGDKEKSSQKEAVLFIKQKLDSAKWFIDAVKQRQNTLYRTMHAIMVRQRDYLLSGDESDLKPLILKEIAQEVEMDISTVSRVASSKYVSTPYGTKLIKEFFSESLTNEQGEEISTYEIKNVLQEMISAEDKTSPYTDEQLTDLLKEKGYLVARRTIAKYREQLDIPVGRLRKKL